MKINNWDYRKRIQSLKVMEEYVCSHAEYGFKLYWDKEIQNLSNKNNIDDIRDDIARNDAKFIDTLFIFYIAVTTSTKWLDDAARNYIKH